MASKLGCPKGYRTVRGVCVGPPDRKGTRKVMLGFAMGLADSFNDWSQVAKNRMVDHIDREHASDFTQGNVDFHLQAGDWHRNEIHGTIELRVPDTYWEAYTEKDDFIEVGEAALHDTIKYDLAGHERDVIEAREVMAEL